MGSQSQPLFWYEIADTLRKEVQCGSIGASGEFLNIVSVFTYNFAETSGFSGASVLRKLILLKVVYFPNKQKDEPSQQAWTERANEA